MKFFPCIRFRYNVFRSWFVGHGISIPSAIFFLVQISSSDFTMWTHKHSKSQPISVFFNPTIPIRRECPFACITAKIHLRTVAADVRVGGTQFEHLVCQRGDALLHGRARFVGRAADDTVSGSLAVDPVKRVADVVDDVLVVDSAFLFGLHLPPIGAPTRRSSLLRYFNSSFSCLSNTASCAANVSPCHLCDRLWLQSLHAGRTLSAVFVPPAFLFIGL